MGDELYKALLILAREHTRDDPVTGFDVQNTDNSPHEYLAAWRTVRAHLGLPIGPASPRVPRARQTNIVQSPLDDTSPEALDGVRKTKETNARLRPPAITP